jgi:hypothetical protein
MDKILIDGSQVCRENLVEKVYHAFLCLHDGLPSRKDEIRFLIHLSHYHQDSCARQLAGSRLFDFISQFRRHEFSISNAAMSRQE